LCLSTICFTLSNDLCAVSPHFQGRDSVVSDDKWPIGIQTSLQFGARNPTAPMKLLSRSLFIGVFQLTTLLTLCGSIRIPLSSTTCPKIFSSSAKNCILLGLKNSHSLRR